MHIDVLSLRTNMNAAVNNIEPSTKDMTRRSRIATGATALISVIAVPVTLLAGLLISTKRKK